MFVVALHTITDADRFYSAAEAGMQDMPEGMRIHSMSPSRDGSRASCLWEADSVDAVKELVEGTVGETSTNEFFEVDSQNAIGLPAAAADQA